MRLTLRTLLAYEHGLLKDQQAAVIAQKIEHSPFVLQLLRHLKDRSSRPEIVPLSLDARGIASLDKVTSYLDYTLSAEEVVKLENECFASDRLLAEVTNCHDVLAQWLSTPAPLDPGLRQQLYALMPDATQEIEPSHDEIEIDLPYLTFRTGGPAAPVAEVKPKTDEPVKKRSFVGTAFQMVALSACVIGLVAFVVMNRGRVEEMIAQHWQQKDQKEVEREVLAEELSKQPSEPRQVDPAPQKFIAQAVPLENKSASMSQANEQTALSEVAVTAFHSPVRSAQPAQAASTGRLQVGNAKGCFFKQTPRASWSMLSHQTIDQGRLVVSLQGQCELHRKDSRIQIASASDIECDDTGSLRLRYGRLDLKLVPGEHLRLHAAGQDVEVSTGDQPVQLRLQTVALSTSGVDFASGLNQELQIEGIAGESLIAISSCRGPFRLTPQQAVAVHKERGVRGIEAGSFDSRLENAAELEAWNLRLQSSSEPLSHLQRDLELTSPNVKAAAALALGQLGQHETLFQVWTQWSDEGQFSPFVPQFRELVAQDPDWASQLKTVLVQQSPQHGPLIYRLICGFSPDQLNDATRAQLETLLRHPEPAVRAWTRFELGFSVTSSPRPWN